MDKGDLIVGIGAIRANKKEGQHFLVNKSVAEQEAKYGEGMRVLELGPGLGTLTDELCKNAKEVVAVEKDPRLFEHLKENLERKNLKLIHGDFFDIEQSSIGKVDIMISNIPYNLSSKVLGWLGTAGIPALLCVQKEFAEHMCAHPGSRSYSRLSVMSSLRFRIYSVRNVPSSDFKPKPNVDSAIIYMTPKNSSIDQRSESIITMLMNHKKKTVRNALIDSKQALGTGKEEIDKIMSSSPYKTMRPFQLEPYQILEVADEVASKLRKSLPSH